MKKNIVAMIAAFCLAAALFGCGSDDEISGSQGQKQDRQPSQQHDAQEDTLSGTAPEDGLTRTEPEEAGRLPGELMTLESTCETILNNCTKEFVGGYLVDVVFLSWIASNYGNDIVFGLAEAVEQGASDPQLWYELTGSSIHVLWNTYCRELGLQSHSLERVYWKECASEDAIVLDFIGDINFSEGWSSTVYLDKQVDGIFDCLSPDVMAELQGADLLMVNNEFTYSTRGEPLAGKAYTFRAHPDRVYLLELMGTDIVSLANNHAYDYGPDALLDTMETLEHAGIPYVGAGENLAEAMMPSYFIANGRKIAIVSATQIERTLNYTRQATETEPGVLKTDDLSKFLSVIETAQACADYVIVYVHWGTEQAAYFESDQTALAQAFVDAGADAIIGGHTHCLQGCQYMDGVPVIYSLGNFWFNSNKLDTGIAQLVIHKDGTMDFRFLPCIQKKNTTVMAEGEEWDRILAYMESISSGVAIDENGTITPTE
ncbi:MAG: CapA family protein [Lachnospiraceae bacterium]|nr:CapA family protein [Lachnospiraceae bacterium]